MKQFTSKNPSIDHHWQLVPKYQQKPQHQLSVDTMLPIKAEVLNEIELQKTRQEGGQTIWDTPRSTENRFSDRSGYAHVSVVKVWNEGKFLIEWKNLSN